MKRRVAWGLIIGSGAMIAIVVLSLVLYGAWMGYGPAGVVLVIVTAVWAGGMVWASGTLLKSEGGFIPKGPPTLPNRPPKPPKGDRQ